MADEELASGSNGVGETLRRAREAKGVGLEEASHVTKIGKNYLAAIEAGEFEKLPNPAYLKGFLRLYATYLGLSGDEVVGQYQNTLPAARQPAAAEPHPEPSAMSVERVKFAGHRRWAIPLLLLCLVILAALFFSEGEEKKEKEKPPTAPAQPAPVAAPAPKPVQPQATSHPQPQAAPAPVQPAAPAQAPAAPPAPGAPQPPTAAPAPGTAATPTVKEPRRGGGVILKLRFKEDTWLSITIDGAISQRYDLKAGDIIEWKGQHGFTLDIGDGSAVEGEFNGKPLKALGEKGKPAHVELKAE